jgi:hypothetical protein
MEFNITLCAGKDSSYSTHDLIKGYVSLKFKEDSAINDVSITLEGKTVVRVEKHPAIWDKAGYVFGDHVFLRMSQPIPPIALPKDRLAKRGSFYEIPFRFTVPETLLPVACGHETTDAGSVRKAHLLLPPSFGSYKTANDVLIDDLTPKRAKVSYHVHARLRRSLDEDRSILLERTQPIRIIPTRTEEPPLFIKLNDLYYRLCQEKSVYMGIPGVGEVVGRLKAEAKQPLSLRMPHPHAQEGGSGTTTTSVSLRFDPTTAGGPPPQLYSIKSKLCAFTFFGAKTYETIPRPDERCETSKEHTYYTNTTRLASRQLGGIGWVKHDAGSIAATPDSSN